MRDVAETKQRSSRQPVASDTTSVREAAERLGISYAMAYRMAGEGALTVTIGNGSTASLPVLKIGTRFKVSRKALDGVIARLEATEAAS
jgi:predicted site-specific integrase-resolvase